MTFNPYKKDVNLYDSSLGDVKWNLNNIFSGAEGIRFYKWLEEQRRSYTFYRLVSEQGMEAGRSYAVSNGFRIDNALWVDATSQRPMPLRNSYYDTWRFSRLTPVMKVGPLGQLMSQMRRPLIRSRCAFMRPGHAHLPAEREYLWHRDESVFVNFRLNIPLRTTSNYFLEDKKLGAFEFEEGYGHSWDTSTMHRANWREKTDDTRIALVLGTNPWFDYDAEEDAYVSNEFFGVKHPFDMLADGDIVNVESLTLE